MKKAHSSILALSAISLALSTTARADEGMWPFNMVSKEAIKKDHGVVLTDAWLDHVRLSSVRFNSGGSGSFVSDGGLVLTNHHVATDCIAKIASASHDYLETGYVAGIDGPEVKCPDLELNVLQSIEDVTSTVTAARKPGMTDADANVAIKGAMATLEKTCTEKTGLRCDVVTLYAGGKYDLYSYKKHTDVRLVFAPEQSLAFFGGDPDNFTFPRFDLDMALFRIYEKDAPVKTKDFLKWNDAGPKDGEVVFVSGHPGSTGRMNTMAELTRLRDTVYPYALDKSGRDLTALREFAKNGAEATREVRAPMFSLMNAVKAVTGFESGLKNAALMKKKADDEAALKKAILADPALKAKYASTFDDAAAAQAKLGVIYKRYAALELAANRSTLFSIARDLVRLPVEVDAPNETRLREYRSSNLDSRKLHLLSSHPIYGGVEVAFYKSWLDRMLRDLGPNDPTVKAVLAGRSPDRAAREIVAGSQLTDLYARRRLYEGGRAAVEKSNDPAILIARAIDAEARVVRKRYEDEVEAPMRTMGEKIAQAVFAVRGSSVAPDATFTLRLSVGVVKGYEEGGKAIPWATNFSGMYAHATAKEPTKLPPRWLAKKGDVKDTVPFNFVSTNDIIGGNSGSPVVNVQGDLVGLIFDGNITSLPNRFIYGETTQRAISVDTAAMLEALSHVYGADALVKELRKP